MARTSVVVDGITLTREQIEKAMQAINEPEPPPLPQFGPGDRVRYGTNMQALVVKECIYTAAIREKYSDRIAQDEVLCFFLGDKWLHGLYFISPTELELISRG